MGAIYYNGCGVEQDYLKATSYFELSAKKFNSDAFYTLGKFYMKGQIYEKDYKKAFKYFEAASN